MITISDVEGFGVLGAVRFDVLGVDGFSACGAVEWDVSDVD